MISRQRINGLTAQRKPLVHFLASLAVIVFLPTAGAVDEVLLKSGQRVSGTIVAQSKDQVVMQVGEGSIVYPKRAIRRIYDGITRDSPVVEIPAGDELPPWWIPLTDLYSADWVNSVESIPATPITSGPFENVPYLSFRANANYELNVFGDPADPAGFGIGYNSRSKPRRDVIENCRNFLFSYLTELDQINAFYDLDPSGGTRSAKGLTIEITPPDSESPFADWGILIYDPDRLAAARTSTRSEFTKTSSRYLDVVRNSTDNVLKWQKWELTDALERLIPMENVNVR